MVGPNSAGGETWQVPLPARPVPRTVPRAAPAPAAASAPGPARKLLFVVNADWFFLSHRLPIALEAQRQGYEVHVAVPITDKLDALRSHGLVVHPLRMNRRGMNPAEEARTFVRLLRLFRSVRPDVVHLVTPKPVLYGGIAARLARTPSVVAAVSGFGFVFIARGWKAAAVRSVVRRMYRLALGHPNATVIVQNPDDAESLLRSASLPRARLRTIPGSGVDLSAYAPEPEPEGTATVVMASRLLRDKGVYEFVDAARILRERGVPARFLLVGEPDPGNPSSLDEAELADLRREGVVQLLGHRADIARVFAEANLVVLPSYREGLPKVLVEAAACGRAVVTTDVPGCRDAIEPDVTGLLVPARNAGALAHAIERLVIDGSLRRGMARAARQLAERRFGIGTVVSAHMTIYRDLVGTLPRGGSLDAAATAQLH